MPPPTPAQSELAAVEPLSETSLTCSDVKQQVQQIQHLLKEVMQKDQHYGTIPGCGDKPTLLKPGAEKLCLTFRMSPSYEIERTDLSSEHREYGVTCTLSHITSGRVLGQGVGCCSTMESKYRYRKAERTCPTCGAAAIIKGKAAYGGGWLCWAKNGGCGAKFADNDAVIVSQQVGRIANEDLADCYNTVLKMAKKRALVDAALTATAASDIFTQDIEDMPEPAQATSHAAREPKVPTVARAPTGGPPQGLADAMDAPHASAPPFGAPTFRFGKHFDRTTKRGLLLSDPSVELDYLEFYGKTVAKSVEDPKKAEFKEQNEAHVAEIRAEYGRRAASREPSEPVAAPASAGHGNYEDIPFNEVQV